MRYGIPLAISSLIACGGVLRAQEVISPPPPDPVPGQRPSQPGGPPLLVQLPNSPSYPAPPGPYPPPQPPGVYGPPPGVYGQPYAPPPGYYGSPTPPGVYDPPPPRSYGRPAYLRGDPAENPVIWVDTEALIWWSKNQPLPIPVVTTGPASQAATAGALGAPGTLSLNQTLNYGAAGGFRMAVGGWCDSDHIWGIEGDVITLGRQGAGFSVYDRSGTGSFVINEPVVGVPFSTQVSAPGVETGGVTVNTTSQFWGGGVKGLFNIMRSDGLTVTALAGFRYFQLDEDLDINSNSALFTTATYTDNMGNTLATAPPGSTVAVFDHFGVRNQFYGGQMGLRFQYVMDRWSLSGTGSLSLGGTHETVSINGVTNVYPVNAQPVYLNGGNYATLQNGGYWVNRFAVAPEFQLKLGYQITPFIRATVGYDFLYLSSVIRPGNQIDNTYDGVVHPVVPMKSSSYWTQGINLGIRVSF